MADSEDAVAKLKQRLEALLAARLEAGDQGLVQQAVACAETAHAGQVRDDSTPYLLHPLRAALILAEEMDVLDPQLLAAALLHDVLEDAPAITAEDLQRRFGTEVGQIVSAVTKEPRRGLSREEATAAYYAALRGSSDAARIVKLADKLDNVRDAVNSPHQDKRRQTAIDARRLFELLAPLLVDRRLATRFQRLLDRALLRLARSHPA